MRAAPEVPLPNPDYLAKDYESFRKLMLDALAGTASGPAEIDPADVVVTLVEVLAYVADYLSYYQDAVSAEAYLATARQRASVRRHARLVDHRLGDGVSARVLVQIIPAVDEVHVARGRALLPKIPGRDGATVSEADYGDYDGDLVFETLHDIRLVRDHTELALAGAAPRHGCTELRLRGTRERLRRGDILLLHHVETGFYHPVRLIRATPDGDGTVIAWRAEDQVPAGVPSGGTWLLRGNIVLADHGRTFEVPLPPVPERGDYAPTFPCASLAQTYAYDHAEALGTAIAGALAPDADLAEPAVTLRELPLSFRADGVERPPWRGRRDLLSVSADDRAFVAEPDGHGTVSLRFGDGGRGRRPQPDWTYRATYRAGGGVSGNVKADSLKHVVGLPGQVIGVSNAISGWGGIDPESLDDARENAPLARRRVRPIAGDPISDLSGPISPADPVAAEPAAAAPAKDRPRGSRGTGAGGLPPRDHAYAAVLGRMRRRASREPPLDRLDTAAPGDVTNALMGAWARVCDVLSFYGARIAEEGYLRTAREPRSILDLAGLLGVTRRSSVSARTYLAAKVLQGADRSGDVVVEPGDLSVQDAPRDPRQSPVVFESSERTVLNPSWNEIALIRAARVDEPRLWKGCDSLRVVGTATGARPGKALLISARGAAAARTWLVTVASVLIDRATGTTLVTWDGGLPDDGGPWPVPVAEAVLFRKTVGLFGQTAPAWDDLPEARRIAAGIRAGGVLGMPVPNRGGEAAPWRSRPNDLPLGAEVRALLETPAKTLLAGTSKGVYRSTDGGERWSRAMLAALVPSIFALGVAPDGLIYAGGAKGCLFASVDDGVSWTSLSPTIDVGSGAPTPERRLLGFLGPTHPTAAPASATLGGTIRAIGSLMPAEKKGGLSPARLIVGTDQGILARSPAGWVPWNKGLPGQDPSSGTAQAAVRGLLVTPQVSFAATNLGLYVAIPDRDAGDALPDWRPLMADRPAWAIVSLAVAGDASAVLVGTDEGLLEIEPSRDGALPRVPATPTDLAGRRVLGLARVGDLLLATTDAGLFWSPLDDRLWRSCDVQLVELLTLDVDEACGRPPDGGRSVPALRRSFRALLGLLRAQGLIAETSGLAFGRPHETGGGIGKPRVWTVVEVPRRPRTARGGAADGPADPGTLPPRAFEIVEGRPAVVRQRLPLPGPAVIGQVSGALWAVAPPGPPLNRDWPGFHIGDGRIFLDRPVQDLEAGSRVVLAEADGSPKAGPDVYAIRRFGEVRRTAFGRTATVTALTVDVDPRQQVHALRRTLAHLDPSVLEAYAPQVDTGEPVEGGSLTVAAALDGLLPGRPVLLSGPRPAVTITRMGGVVAVSGPPEAGLLEQESVLALAAVGRTLFAATESGLIVERSGDGPARAAGRGIPPDAVVRVLAAHPGRRAIVAATANHGVFCRTLDGVPPPATAPVWRRLGQAAPVSIAALAVMADGTVLAGTPQGVLSCPVPADPAGDGPTGWSGPEIGRPVHCLSVGADGRCFAGLDDGRVWALRPGAGWAALPALPILPAPRVDAVAAGDAGLMLAGCEDGRIFIHADLVGWRLVCRVAGGAPIRSLLIADGRLFVGTRGSGALVWRAGEGLRPTGIRRSSDVRAMARTEAGTILAALDAAVHLDGAEPRVLERRAFADAGAEAGPALDRGILPPSIAPVFAGAGAKLSGDAGAEVLDPGRRWLIRDRDRAWIAERLPSGLTDPDAPALLRLYGADPLELAALPRRDAERWTVIHDGRRGSFAVPWDAVSLQAARSDQQANSEIADLARVEAAPGGTRLAFAVSLREIYDRKALRIGANLVPVTQGDTPAIEILGSGDGTQAHQCFTLRRPVAGARDSEGGVQPSLQVRVLSSQASPLLAGLDRRPGDPEGQVWRETASFLAEGPHDRVYMLRRDEKDRTSVHFGDGVHGARLPAGSENVVARYRSGAGRTGNVAAGTLIALRRRPIGIVAVTNPLEATGGRDVQPIEDLRVRAPWQRGASSGRIVSLDDYTAFAMGVLGVDRARAEFFAPVRTVCLWILAEEGASDEQQADVVDRLGLRVRAARVDRFPLHVESLTIRPFRIAAWIVPRHAAGPDAAARLRRRASHALSAHARSCPEAISRGAVRALLRGLAGVEDADVTALHAVEGPPRIETLRARPAWYDPARGRLAPPDVHLVRSADIALDIRPA